MLTITSSSGVANRHGMHATVSTLNCRLQKYRSAVRRGASSVLYPISMEPTHSVVQPSQLPAQLYANACFVSGSRF